MNANNKHSANIAPSTISGNQAQPDHPGQVGQKLRQLRESRSLSLEQVSQVTRIRIHYLKALEAGEFDALPSMAQARGFLRAYGGFLGLDGETLLRGSENLAQTSPEPESETPQADNLHETQPAAPALPVQPSEPEKSSSHTIFLVTPRPSSPAPSPESKEAQLVFIEIGKHLKRQRELLGISLDDVERYTHLRQHYLKALEAGDLEGMPSPVQGRGMLNNYATFLGLDPEPLLLRFADGLQTRLAARKSAAPPPQPKPATRNARLPAPLRKIFSADVLIGFVLVAFMTAFITWGAIRIFALQSEHSPTPTTLSIADVLLASPTPTASATPIPATPTSPLPPALMPQSAGTDSMSGEFLPSESQGKVQIYVSVQQRAWMRVTVDDKIEFEGRVLPGSAYTFVGNSQVEILTGNGAALKIYYGQSDLGLMGSFGQVVNRIYTAQEVLNPTPTNTPTSPATETPDATIPVTETSAPGLP